jgi:uncharacterized protein YydD (DUF2326 family)
MFSIIYSILLAAAPMAAEPPSPALAAVELPAPVASAIAEIRAHHLDSTEGREAFLVDKMRSFTARAEALNQEIQDLFHQTQDPANQEHVLEIANALQEKMAALEPMLPILNEATSLDVDFQQIDTVLQKLPPLKENEQEMLLRVARISAYVDSIDLNTAANS